MLERAWLFKTEMVFVCGHKHEAQKNRTASKILDEKIMRPDGGEPSSPNSTMTDMFRPSLKRRKTTAPNAENLLLLFPGNVGALAHSSYACLG